MYPSYTYTRLLTSAISVALMLAVAAPASAFAAKTKLVSKSSGGVQADGTSRDAEISASGRYVVFETRGTNLGPADSNGGYDVYIRDLRTGKTKLISKAIGGGTGNADSRDPVVSGSGRFVAFTSTATDLVAGGDADESVYLYDRRKKRMELVSRHPGGASGGGFSAAISADGRFVAFTSGDNGVTPEDNNGVEQVYVHDRKKDKTMLVSRTRGGVAGNDHSFDADVSPDGKWVAYTSLATNLSSKDERGVEQVFLFDKARKRSRLISRNGNGTAGGDDSNHASVSRNGAKVVFNSLATDLGKDTNGTADVYLHTRANGKTRRASLNWRGKQLNQGSDTSLNTDPDISADGKVIAFESQATNATKGSTHPGTYDQIYARKLGSGNVTLLSRRKSRANGENDEPELSASGAFVAFDSAATNLVKGGDATGGDADVFRRGRLN